VIKRAAEPPATLGQGAHLAHFARVESGDPTRLAPVGRAQYKGRCFFRRHEMIPLTIEEEEVDSPQIRRGDQESGGRTVFLLHFSLFPFPSSLCAFSAVTSFFFLFLCVLPRRPAFR